MSSVTAKKDRVSKVESARDDGDKSRVDLVQADRALLSLRASGHDYCSAVGEVFDNSIQANANCIRLRLFTEKRTVGKNTSERKSSNAWPWVTMATE